MNAQPTGVTSTEQAGKSYVYLVSFVAAIGGFLFGMDLNIIGSAMIFLKDQFQLEPGQMGFTAGSALLGCVFGPILGVLLGDKLGRRRCLYLAALLFAISAVGTALPETIGQFNFFRFIGGLGVGFSSVVAPMFIAEISPAVKRGRLVLMYQLAITLGAMLGVITAWILAATLAETISWRWMFGSEVVPCAVFGIATICVWVAGYTGTQFFPMLGSYFENRGLPGAVYWVFSAICVFSLIFGIKLLPETKGRTLEEIAASWMKR